MRNLETIAAESRAYWKTIFNRVGDSAPSTCIISIALAAIVNLHWGAIYFLSAFGISFIYAAGYVDGFGACKTEQETTR